MTETNDDTGEGLPPDRPTTSRRGGSGLPKGRHHVDPASLNEVRALLGDAPRQRDLLIEHLHRIQDACHQISAEHLAALAEEMRLSLAEVFETATFYAHFDVVRDGDPAVPPITIRVCDSIACAMAGAETLFAALRATAGQAIRVLRAPCIGLCDQAPAVAVGHAPLGHATPEEALAAVRAVETQARLPSYVDHDAYHAGGGYALLKRLRLGEFSSDAVIDALDKAALRGLGGAGFPTGRKWRTVRSERGPRLMVVNGDEGEPGTFKDRFYLESDPHRFLEGMLIGAHVVEATDVYLYIRDEYPAAREILAREIAKLPEGGPTLHLRRGAGPISAARNRHSSSRSRASAACRATSRLSFIRRGSSAGRRSSTMSRRSSGCATSSSVVPIGGRDKGAMAARASVPSRFRAAYGTPA